jgi:hypothetical protein
MHDVGVLTRQRNELPVWSSIIANILKHRDARETMESSRLFLGGVVCPVPTKIWLRLTL